MLTLDIQARETHGSLDDLRTSGVVPAVCYGPKEKAVAVGVNTKAFLQIWREAGETTLVSLKGVGEAKNALIREIQYHPLTGNVIHIDFYVPEKGKKIKIEVPLVFEGVAPAEKLGLQVVKTMHEIEIEVAPEHIPHNLIVNVSTLAQDGDRIVASDIALPHGAELVTDADEIIASVVEAQEEAVETPVAAATTEAGAAVQPTTGEKKAPEQK